MNEPSVAAKTVPADMPAKAARPRRRSWIAVLLSCVIFACGFLAGGSVVFLYLRNQALFAVHHPQRMPSQIARRLTNLLDLSPDQAAAVQQILQRRQSRLMEIRRDVQPRVVVELDQLEREIAAVLNPRQQEEWHAITRRLRRTWLPPLPPSQGDAKPT